MNNKKEVNERFSSAIQEVRVYFRKHGNPYSLPINDEGMRMQPDGTIYWVSSDLSEQTKKDLYLLEQEKIVRVFQDRVFLDKKFIDRIPPEEIKQRFIEKASELKNKGLASRERLFKLRASFAIYYQYHKMGLLVDDYIEEIAPETHQRKGELVRW